jgi:hypothetical protein
MNEPERSVELNTLNDFIKRIMDDCNVSVDVSLEKGKFLVRGEKRNVLKAIKDVKNLPATIV